MPQINWIQVSTFLSANGAAPATYIPISAIPADAGVAPFAEAAKLYPSTTAMLEDGWLSTDAAVLAATQVLGQTSFTPTPPTRVCIVNRAAAVAQISEFSPLVFIDGTYKLFLSILGGTPVEVASFVAVTSSLALIKNGLLASLAGGPAVGTVTGATVDVDTGSATANVPGVPFVLSGEGPNGAADIEIDNGIAVSSGLYEDLDDAFLVVKFWAVIPDPAEADGTKREAGRWAQASAQSNSSRRNIALLQTNDADILTATEPNLASDLVRLNYDRSFGLYLPNTSDKMTAAWFGLYGGQAGGSRMWHYRALTGTTETTAINYTQTQVDNVIAQRVSLVERDGPSATSPLRVVHGMGAGGKFVVQKQAEDRWWFETSVAISTVMASLGGANMDDEGINQYVTAVNIVNAGLGSTTPAIIDLNQTTVTPVPIEDVPASEQEVGDYQTTGGINVSTVLIPKIRKIAVSATFALSSP